MSPKKVIELIPCLVTIAATAPRKPIEQAWSQARSWLLKKSPPTFDALVLSIGDALCRATPEHCRNHFINSGNRVTQEGSALVR